MRNAESMFVVLTLAFSVAPAAWGMDLPKEVGPETKACIECHRKHTAGIVHDWAKSRHAWTKPDAALEKPGVTRRISVDRVPERFSRKVVGCFECHGQRADSHADTFDNMGYRIHVVVSPKDCETCHPVEAAQLSKGKKASAHENLDQNPLYGLLQETTIGGSRWEGGRLAPQPATPETRWETCFGCHGTRVTVRGITKVASSAGEITVPDLANWPNQGVGRVNPDGSNGACTPCHARHGFSIEEARRPETCAQCHSEPDAPAWSVYRDSKHGGLSDIRQLEFEWDSVPWVLGRDFTAPTCAACHVSLLQREDGEVVAQRSHDFGARLWVRIFGLPYSHPQPSAGATHTLRNPDAQSLPVGLDGRPAAQGLIAPEEQARRKAAMTAVCNGCHNRQWVRGHFEKFEASVRDADAALVATSKMMQEAWAKAMADRGNPFDEPLEQIWLKGWLFHGNSIRYTSAMAGGADYATFKDGWWSLNEAAKLMEAALRAAKAP